MKNYPPCVILCGPVLAPALSVMRSVGRHGVPVYVMVLNDAKKSASIYAKSFYCKTATTIPRDADAEDICNNILAWTETFNFSLKPVLFPVTDQACTYVAECRSRLENHFDVCMARSDIILDMLDKPKANSLAQAHGLDVPKFGRASCYTELLKLSNELSFPVIVKPTWWRERGKSKIKAVRCDTREQLLSKGREFIDFEATLMVQEYITGDDSSVEFYMFYRSSDGNTIQGCTGRKIRQIPPGAGIMASGESLWLPHVSEISDRFLRSLDYRGIGGLEYKRHRGKSYFIEMNVRTESCNSLAAGAGVDLAWYVYLDIALKRMPRERVQQKRVYYLIGQAYRNLIISHRQGFPAFMEMLKFIFSGKTCYSLWSHRDPIPWIMLLPYDRLWLKIKKLFKM